MSTPPSSAETLFALSQHRAAPLLLLLGFCCAPIFVVAAPAGPFHAAAKAGDVAALDRALVDQPNDFDRPDAAGNTPLMVAAAEAHVAAVEWLLARGANANVRHGAETPLKQALMWQGMLDGRFLETFSKIRA